MEVALVHRPLEYDNRMNRPRYPLSLLREGDTLLVGDVVDDEAAASAVEDDGDGVAEDTVLV